MIRHEYQVLMPGILKNMAAIVAMTKNRVIGLNNAMPWHLSDDLKRFKQLTLNHTVVMGRKTFESIGKPLPQRHNVILTRDLDFLAPGCTILHKPSQVIELAESTTDVIFILGGEAVFRLLLPHIAIIYLTLIEAELTGDTFFPELNHLEWEETQCQRHPRNEKNTFPFSFITLIRREQC